MKLILVRHAAAIISNRNRFLTLDGRMFFRKTARTMLKAGLRPGLIATSPLIRALQTADILAEILSYTGPLVVLDELERDFDVAVLHELLDDYPDLEELVLVGHEPDMSGLAKSLLCLAECFSFEKGTAIHLKIDRNDLKAPATFKWLAAGSKLITSRKEAFPALHHP